MTKLWISDKLELRYSETGWPELNKANCTGKPLCCEGQQCQHLAHEAALAKAKDESIAVDGGTIPGSLTHTLMTAEPDTFIEAEGEVEVIYQQDDCRLDNPSWCDISLESYRQNPGFPTRKVARFKQTKTVTEETHPEDFFQDCGGKNPVWFAANDLWNKVRPQGGIICPICFQEECDKKGESVIFEARRAKKVDHPTNPSHNYTEGAEEYFCYVGLKTIK